MQGLLAAFFIILVWNKSSNKQKHIEDSHIKPDVDVAGKTTTLDPLAP